MMSKSAMELLELACRQEVSEDSITIPGKTLHQFNLASREAVSEEDARVSLAKFILMAEQIILSIKNQEAAGKRKGVYLSEGQVFANGVLMDIQDRNLEIVTYILRYGPASIPELKLRFWPRNNDEKEATDRSVTDAVRHINEKINEYGAWMSAEDGRYDIFCTMQLNTQCE